MSETKRYGDPVNGGRRVFCPLLPMRDYLIAREVKIQRVGMIEMPDESNVDKRLEVIAVGPDVQRVQVGDYIIPNPQYTGSAVVEGKKYFIMQEDDVPALFCKSRGIEVAAEIRTV